MHLRRVGRNAVTVLMAISGVLTLGSCSFVASPAGSISSPVWLEDDSIYFIRDDDHTVWLQRGEDSDAELLNIGLPGMCEGGSPFSLGRLPQGRLSITIGCFDSFQQIFAYSPGVKQANLLLKGRNIRDSAWNSDLTAGYIVLFRMDGCYGLVEFSSLTVPAAPAGCGVAPPVPQKSSCDFAISRSPVLTIDGTLFYLATSSRVSPTVSEHWALCRKGSDGSPAEQIGADIVGIGELDVSPDGRFVVVTAMAEHADGTLFLVDSRSGKRRVIDSESSVFDPSFSPDGKRVVFVDDLYRLGFQSVV